MHKIILLLFVSFFGSKTKSQKLDSLDYLIYSIIIKNSIGYLKDSPDLKSVTVLNRTSKDWEGYPIYDDTTERSGKISAWDFRFRTQFDSSDYENYIRFITMKEKHRMIGDEFILPIKIFLLKKSRFHKYFKHDPESGWRHYYQEYPDSYGVYEFSNIYYSENKLCAILSYALRRKSLNGYASIIILKKENNEWKIDKAGDLWQN